jgi:hypothetical protein
MKTHFYVAFFLIHILVGYYSIPTWTNNYLDQYKRGWFYQEVKPFDGLYLDPPRPYQKEMYRVA